jgi:hypothetical protein
MIFVVQIILFIYILFIFILFANFRKKLVNDILLNDSENYKYEIMLELAKLIKFRTGIKNYFYAFILVIYIFH